jgi:predicted TIM-barrel fold metal-dependent hydrolase
MTRRDSFRAAMAAATILRARLGFAKASQPGTPVNFDVPPNACDCHTHIFGDPKQFPLWPGRGYPPETASPEEMSELHRALHMQRVVIVTPSIYGTDNSATLFGIKARGANARGVAVIDDKTPDSDLDAMGRGGIRAIRINLTNAGQTDPAIARQRFRAAVKRVQHRDWHIEMYTTLAVISGIKDLVQASPAPVVFDHFGGAQAALGVHQPGFADLAGLIQSGKAYVKISGAYRASTQAPDYPDVKPLAQMLIAANVDRIVWGSDLPHPHPEAQQGHPLTEVTPLYQIDDGRLLNLLRRWAPDAATRKKILVDNPARLYGF